MARNWDKVKRQVRKEGIYAKPAFLACLPTPRDQLAKAAALRKAAAVPIPPNRGPERLLAVKTEFFSATAVWQKIFGAWSCTKADPQLAWMAGMTADKAALALLRMGADFEFSSVVSPQKDRPQTSDFPGAGLETQPDTRTSKAQRPLEPSGTTGVATPTRPQTGPGTIAKPPHVAQPDEP